MNTQDLKAEVHNPQNTKYAMTKIVQIGSSQEGPWQPEHMVWDGYLCGPFIIQPDRRPDMNDNGPAWSLLFNGHKIAWTTEGPDCLKAYAEDLLAPIIERLGIEDGNNSQAQRLAALEDVAVAGRLALDTLMSGLGAGGLPGLQASAIRLQAAEILDNSLAKLDALETP
jgi:hypothetical protein